MNAFKNKVQQFISHKKLNKLWNDYKKVANLDDLSQKSEKLNSFLTQFKKLSIEYLEAQKEKGTLNKFFANTNELLSVLICEISNYNEPSTPSKQTPESKFSEFGPLFRNVIETIEVILKNGQYEEEIKSSGSLIWNVLSMLENVSQSDLKVISIRLIALLTTKLEDKLEFGKNDGFRRLVRLLIVESMDSPEEEKKEGEIGEEVFNQEIILAFMQILGIEEEDMTSISLQDQDLSSSCSMQALDLDSKGDREALSSPIAPSPSAYKKLNFDIFSRMTETSLETTGHIGKEKIHIHSAKQTFTCSSLFRGNIKINKTPEEQEDKLTEYLRAQEVLKDMTHVLFRTHTATQQLDILKIIAKLLIHNTKNQQHFSKIEGYQIIAFVLNQERDFKDPKIIEFLQRGFRILQKIIQNSERGSEKEIWNKEGMKILLSILAQSEYFEVIRECLKCLFRILSDDVMNIMIFKSLQGFTDLQLLLIKICFPRSSFREIGNLRSEEFLPPQITETISKLKGVGRDTDTGVGGEIDMDIERERLNMEVFVQIEEMSTYLYLICSSMGGITIHQIYASLLHIQSHLGCMSPYIEHKILTKLHAFMEHRAGSTNPPTNIELCAEYEGSIWGISRYFVAQKEEEVRESALILLIKFLEDYSHILSHSGNNKLETPKGELIQHTLGLMSSPPSPLSFFHKSSLLFHLLLQIMNTDKHPNPTLPVLASVAIELIIAITIPPTFPYILNFIHDSLFAPTIHALHLIYLQNVVLNGVLARPLWAAYYGGTSANMNKIYNKMITDLKEGNLITLYRVYVICKDNPEHKEYFSANFKVIEFCNALSIRKYTKSIQQEIFNILLELTYTNRRKGPNANFEVLMNLDENEAIWELIEIRNEVSIKHKIQEKPKEEQKVESDSYWWLIEETKQPKWGSESIMSGIFLLLLEAEEDTEIATLSEVLWGMEREENKRILVQTEIIEIIFQIYEDLGTKVQDLYLSICTRIMEYGISGETNIFLDAFRNPQIFQAVVKALEGDQISYYLSISQDIYGLDYSGTLHPTEPEDLTRSYIQSTQIYNFPRSGKGYSMTFWAKFNSLLEGDKLDVLSIVDEARNCLLRICIMQNGGSSSSSPKNSPTGPKSPDSTPTTLSIPPHCKYTPNISLQLYSGNNNNSRDAKLPFALNSSFTHICIMHSKSQIQIFLNAREVLSISNPVYPFGAKGVGMFVRIGGELLAVSEISLYEGVIGRGRMDSMYFNRGEESSVGDKKASNRILSFPSLPVDYIHTYSHTKIKMGKSGDEDKDEEDVHEVKMSTNKVLHMYSVESPPKYLSERIKLSPQEFTSPMKSTTATSTRSQTPKPQAAQSTPPPLPLTPSPTPSTPQAPRIIGCRGEGCEIEIHHTYTLKEFLSSTHVLQYLLRHMLPSPRFQISLNVLKYLFISNSHILHIFTHLNGYTCLLHLFRKHINAHPAHTRLVFYTLFDILGNSSTLHEMLDVLTRTKEKEVPNIYQSKIEFLRVAMYVLSESPIPELEKPLIMLLNLIQREENFQIFANMEGLNFLFNMLLRCRQTQTQTTETHSDILGSYERLLEIFCLFLEYNNTLNMSYLLAFLKYTMDLSHTNRNSLLEYMVVDLLSLLNIHILLQPHLLPKLVSSNGIQFIYLCLEHPSDMIREYAIRMIGTLIHVSPDKLRGSLVKSRAFDMVSDKLRTYQPNLIMLQSILDLGVDTFKNVNCLYPNGSTHISSILNRSSVAYLLIQNIRLYHQILREPDIQFSEAYPTLFLLLTASPYYPHVANILRQFESILNLQNINHLLGDTQFFPCLCLFLNIIHSKITDLKDPIAAQHNTLDLKDRESLDVIFSTTINILVSLMLFDLNKPGKQSKAFGLLANIPYSIDHTQTLLLENMGNYLAKYPQLHKEDVNLIKNLSHLLSNMESLIQSNMKLKLKYIKLINLFVCHSSNTRQVRTIMKTSGLFELRDNMIMDILLSKTYPQEFVEVLTNYSLETVAALAKFREQHVIEHLLQYLLEIDKEETQKSILEVLKNDICCSEENCKVILRIMDENILTRYLFKTKTVTSSGVFQCITFHKEEEEGSEGEETKLEGTQEVIPNTNLIRVIQFINDQPNPIRKAIIDKLDKPVSAVQNERWNKQHKLGNERSGKRKKILNELMKEKQTMEKYLAENENGLRILKEELNKIELENKLMEYRNKMKEYRKLGGIKYRKISA